jgi:catechol 2,3-dioxygenase
MAAAIRPNFSHAGLYVYDIEKMCRFYTTVIGLVVSDRGKGPRTGLDFVFLSADPTKHHQLVLAAGRAPESRKSTINQLSFVLGSLDELRRMYRRVKEQGVAPVRCIDHGNAWSIYFADPEDNTVELYCDSPWYVAQPHAEPFDLDLSDDQILSRSEAAARLEPSFMLAADWRAKMRRVLGLERA